MGDIGCFRHEDATDGKTFDVHAENFLGVFESFVGILGILDTTGFAASTDVDLRLDHDRTSVVGCDGAGFFSGRCHFAARYGNTESGKDFFGLILMYLHL